MKHIKKFENFDHDQDCAPCNHEEDEILDNPNMDEDEDDLDIDYKRRNRYSKENLDDVPQQEVTFEKKKNKLKDIDPNIGKKLTSAQKKLPIGLQKAILSKKKK